ncbi:MAG: autotransporter translocation and assembly factor TamB, partial [Flavobacteriales bacterium]
MGRVTSIARVASRWGLRALALVMLVLLIVVAAVVGVTQTKPGRAFVAGKLVEVLNESVFAGEIAVEQLSGPLFGAATLRGVTLRADDGTILATLESLDVDFQLLPLRERHVVIDRLELRTLAVLGTITEDGTVDLSGAIAQSESPPSGGP